MIDARVLDMRPHPDQATNNPGCWAVKLRVAHEGNSRTFWRWHNAWTSKGGCRVPSEVKPTAAEILDHFWLDTFYSLHGFDFEEGLP